MGLSYIAFASAAESLLTSWWQVILVMVVSFVGITLCWSLYRFRLILASMTRPESVVAQEGVDFFKVLIAQRISSMGSQTEFSVGVIRASGMEMDELCEFVQRLQRADTDSVVRTQDWVGVIISGERAGLDAAFARWRKGLNKPLVGGAASYPENARASFDLISAAEACMQRVSLESGGLVWAESGGGESHDGNEEEDAEGDIGLDSSLDPLTGVLAINKVASYMRKFVGEYRQRHPLSLLFIGITSIADIEELHGKDAGDAVRKAVGDLIQGELRVDDVIGRYDDDAFLALLICDEPSVSSIAARLRDRAQKMVVNYQNRRIKVVVNIGISVCPRHGRNLPALFKAAKEAYDVVERRRGSMFLIAGE